MRVNTFEVVRSEVNSQEALAKWQIDAFHTLLTCEFLMQSLTLYLRVLLFLKQ